VHRYIDLPFPEILELMEIRGHLRKFVANQEKAMSNDREAARLYKLAAAQGYANAAQYNLGVFYEHGRGGLAKNVREAASFYRLAADQGNTSAQCNLGVFYTDGRGARHCSASNFEALAQNFAHQLFLRNTSIDTTLGSL
jgi:TPR repeat protein